LLDQRRGLPENSWASGPPCHRIRRHRARLPRRRSGRHRSVSLRLGDAVAGRPGDREGSEWTGQVPGFRHWRHEMTSATTGPAWGGLCAYGSRANLQAA